MECQENLDQLYSIANEVVGCVGESSNTYCSVTGEEFQEIVITFEDDWDLLEKWENWIKGYRAFAKHQFKGCVNWTANILRIYWNTKPEYLKHRKGMYARLLVTNKPEIFEGGG